MESWTTAAPFLGLAGLVCSLALYAHVKKGPVGTQEMAAISEAIHEGAMAFLKREYTILLVFVVAVFALLFVFVGAQTAYAFIAGAACSIAAGFTGMKAATARYDSGDVLRISGCFNLVNDTTPRSHDILCHCVCHECDGRLCRLAGA